MREVKSDQYRIHRACEVARFQRLALIVGIVALIVFGAGAFFDKTQFFRAYLVGYLFWAGIAVGSLVLLMLQHLTGGGWGLVIRRPLEAATRTLPVVLLLFVPILLGANSIYSWTDHEKMAENPALAAKARLYLNLKFFSLRAAVCFAIWLLLSFFLNRWSRAQDRTGDRQFAKKMRVLSGPGMVLFVFTVTLAAIDWVMSLDPSWSSTIFGLLFVAAWGLTALAFVIAALAWLAKDEPMATVVAPLHFHDLGKLLLALVMLWAYFAYSQYLIIWSGNLPEEIRWYLPQNARHLGRNRAGRSRAALRAAVSVFAVAALEAQSAQTGFGCSADLSDALCGSALGSCA